MIELSLPNGERARVLEVEGERVTLLASVPAPPGTPLAAELEGQSYQVKVRSCRRTSDDPVLAFRIDGRFQNLSRAQRERLARSHP